MPCSTGSEPTEVHLSGTFGVYSVCRWRHSKNHTSELGAPNLDIRTPQHVNSKTCFCVPSDGTTSVQQRHSLRSMTLRSPGDHTNMSQQGNRRGANYANSETRAGITARQPSESRSSNELRKRDAYRSPSRLTQEWKHRFSGVSEHDDHGPSLNAGPCAFGLLGGLCLFFGLSGLEGRRVLGFWIFK